MRLYSAYSLAALLAKMLTARPTVPLAASSQPEPVSEPRPDRRLDAGSRLLVAFCCLYKAA